MRNLLICIFVTICWAVCTALCTSLQARAFRPYCTENGPPPEYKGPLFKLSQKYPTSLPKTNQPWLKVDFHKDPQAYALAIRDYAFGENLHDGQWITDEKRWFHVPYLHPGIEGREFVHGLTRERAAKPLQLHQKQKSTLQNWGVAVYNGPGGYAIGKLWRSQKPHLEPAAKPFLFPEGTVCTKLLFTDAPDDQVPFLKGTVEWQAAVNERGTATVDEPLGPILNTRKVKTMRLLQIDIAVRDSRADDTTGWVLGTFVYDSRNSGADGWHRMVPVGLMWGDDPTLTCGKGPPKESWINPDLPLQGPFGWCGRLNGPVDNRQSSCISCHATASYPASPSLPPNDATDEQRLIWFRNIKAGTPFAPVGVLPLDYSLQVAKAVNTYFDEHPKEKKTSGTIVRGMRDEGVPITRADTDDPKNQERIWNFLQDHFAAAQSKRK